MKFKFILFILSLFCLIVSCKKEKTLSEAEKNVIVKDIPEKLYKEEMENMSQTLFDYIWEGVSDYVEVQKSQTQKEVREIQATKAFLGGSLDPAALFGSSTESLIAQRIPKYINYVNQHQKELGDLIVKITNILANHPEFIKKFESGEFGQSVPLNEFASTNYLPASIDVSSFEDYENLGFDTQDRMDWGEAIMGALKKPSFSAVAVFYATVTAMSHIIYPEATYAVYEEEDDSWEVG